MNRIDKLFEKLKKEGRSALITYICAGDPDLDTTEKLVLELEKSGASADDIRNFLGYSRARTGQLEGDLENGEAYCGASAGLIKEIIPAAMVVQNLVEGYEKILKKII